MAGLVDVGAAHRESNLEAILSDLDRELVGLRSVKSYICSSSAKVGLLRLGS
jgi:hypothetical protein